ncbi:dGTP triphosphohydrolase [Ruicaihuangia caeni]|uniref:dGTP triphosphohydrolase n=1 Tax=Ruicaihuangia caeni TaxID=3042517 RepID=UPI00338F52A3
MTRRTARQHPELHDASSRDEHAEYRVDIERIRFSPFYSRLSAVTQVISQPGAGAQIHNRLTHSIKVAAVARAIAVRMQAEQLESMRGRPREVEEDKAVIDPVVVQAAAAAHDLGHPPFGHLGESILDRMARETLGLADGFEGNAQSYRIVTVLDVIDEAARGLNLTAAVRTALAKYPWTSATDPELLGAEPRRGIRRHPDQLDIHKYSAYLIDAHDLEDARRDHGGLRPFEQSVECAIMDVADDIAYSVHDVEDFYRAGLLGHASIAAEFRGWLDARAAWARFDDADLQGDQTPGAGLESLRRKIARNDAWIADDEAFRSAVVSTSADLIDSLLARPFDGSLEAERLLASFTARWIGRLQDAVVLIPRPVSRSGPVSLDVQAWHEVEVLKFVHKRFVLSRPDLAIYQRGLGRVLVRAVNSLMAWLQDEDDSLRVPRRLGDLIALAHEGYRALDPDVLARLQPEGSPSIDGLARARGVLDYVASLTDNQALALAEAVSGRTDRLWELGQSL